MTPNLWCSYDYYSVYTYYLLSLPAILETALLATMSAGLNSLPDGINQNFLSRY